MAGYYEGADGEKQANKTRALNVVQFIADIAESNRRQLCDTSGAMKGMRYSTFTLNVLAGLTAAGGAAAGRVQHLNLGGPSTSTLERHTRRLRVQFDPLNPANNVEAYAAFIKDGLDAHAGHDASKRHVYIEYVRYLGVVIIGVVRLPVLRRRHCRRCAAAAAAACVALVMVAVLLVGVARV